jgi:hypothetical protein
MRNPYVLAGIAVGAAIVLAVVVVFLFGTSGSGSAGDNDGGGLVIDPLTPGPGRGVAARSLAAATVREGPALDYIAVGELNRNQDVEVVGRNDEGTWFNIYFPPGSSLRGWVPASALRLPSNSAAIPVVSVTPIPRPTVIIPTATQAPAEATATPTPTTTGTPAGGADLEARIVPGTCSPGNQLIINVINRGPGGISSRAVQVLVQNASGATLATAAQLATIPAGGQIDIATNYVVQERVIAIIDPLQTLGDPNTANNRVDCVVAGVPGSGTPTSAVPPPIATATRTPTP